MIGLVRCLLALAALVLAPTQLSRAAEQVDLLLVLSSDVSRSVDHPKFLLQREGYAAAISDPQVMDAIKSGPHQRIAVCFVEWSGFGAQKLVIDWTMIDSPGAARKFGDQLLELPRAFADRTSISGGIEFATPSWSVRRSRVRAVPSTSPETGPTTPAATSSSPATRLSPRAS